MVGIWYAPNKESPAYPWMAYDQDLLQTWTHEGRRYVSHPFTSGYDLVPTGPIVYMGEELTTEEITLKPNDCLGLADISPQKEITPDRLTETKPDYGNLLVIQQEAIGELKRQVDAKTLRLHRTEDALRFVLEALHQAAQGGEFSSFIHAARMLILKANGGDERDFGRIKKRLKNVKTLEKENEALKKEIDDLKMTIQAGQFVAKAEQAIGDELRDVAYLEAHKIWFGTKTFLDSTKLRKSVNAAVTAVLERIADTNKGLRGENEDIKRQLDVQTELVAVLDHQIQKLERGTLFGSELPPPPRRIYQVTDEDADLLASLLEVHPDKFALQAFADRRQLTDGRPIYLGKATEPTPTVKDSLIAQPIKAERFVVTEEEAADVLRERPDISWIRIPCPGETPARKVIWEAAPAESPEGQK